MKKLLLIVFLPLVFSCAESTNSESESDTDFDFSYAIDTVMVDAGDGFIYLKRFLATSVISPDQKTLYNYNPEAAELEIIDLEKLVLKERIKMESEGPLGTGQPMELALSTDRRFSFINFFDVRTFTPSLDSMQTFRIRRGKFEALESEEVLSPGFMVSDDGKRLFAPYGLDDESIPQRGIALVDMEDKSLKKIRLEIYAKLQAYVMTTPPQDGEIQMRTTEPVYFKQVGERLLISSASLNEVYILDLQTDSVTHKVYQSALTKNSKKVPEKNIMASPEEVQTYFKEINNQVNFGKFYFDDKENRFWRVSRELDRMIGDSATFKQIITVFDHELNQLHEQSVPIDFFSYKFFKDGKLWSYVNVDDELGFAVFTFEF